jgi:hypothetical protein
MRKLFSVFCVPESQNVMVNRAALLFYQQDICFLGPPRLVIEVCFDVSEKQRTAPFFWAIVSDGSIWE